MRDPERVEADADAPEGQVLGEEVGTPLGVKPETITVVDTSTDPDGETTLGVELGMTPGADVLIEAAPGGAPEPVPAAEPPPGTEPNPEGDGTAEVSVPVGPDAVPDA